MFFYGNLEDIAVDNPTRDRWFNVDAGFERDPAKVPAAFQKRTFPFRVDGVREDRMQILNMNVMRVIPFGRGKSLQLRVDVVNALNDEQLLAPNLDPTSTQFGMVTNAQNSVGRWITFMTKLTF